MRFPQVVIGASDEWLAEPFREAAAGHRWLFRTPRTAAAALALAREPRPTLLVVRIDPADPDPAYLDLLADAHRLCPDVPAVAVGGAKLPDADRAAWTAALLDLGARYVLFPPLSKAVVEDLAGGLMASAVRRTVPGGGEPAADVIDLARGGADG